MRPAFLSTTIQNIFDCAIDTLWRHGIARNDYMSIRSHSIQSRQPLTIQCQILHIELKLIEFRDAFIYLMLSDRSGNHSRLHMATDLSPVRYIFLNTRRRPYVWISCQMSRSAHTWTYCCWRCTQRDPHAHSDIRPKIPAATYRTVCRCTRMLWASDPSAIQLTANGTRRNQANDFL